MLNHGGSQQMTAVADALFSTEPTEIAEDTNGRRLRWREGLWGFRAECKRTARNKVKALGALGRPPRRSGSPTHDSRSPPGPVSVIMTLRLIA